MKILAKIVIIIFVFFVGFLYGQRYITDNGQENYSQDVSEEEKQELVASLVLDFGNGEIKNFEAVKIDENSTVFSLLQNTLEVNDMDMEYKDYGEEMGVMVESIGGIKNNFNAGKYWQYWINGEYAKVGASLQNVNNKDMIEWKYTEGQF